MPDSSADRDPLDRLADEFVARLRAGQRPALSEYADQHPELADQIRDLFPALVEMEHLKPATGEHTGAFEPAAQVSDPVRVGEFRIVRRIDQGGMGVVFEAVQESLGRHVALKMLPTEAVADPKRVERFRREAQAAARLHHTNIVPVFGVGAAEGRHFYAMQFISGHPLDAVIDEVKRLKEKSVVLPSAPRPVSEVAAALLTGAFAPASRERQRPEAGNGTAVADAPGPPETPVAHAPGSPPPPAPLSGNISEGGRHFWGTVARIGEQAADALAYAHAQGILHRDIKPANLLLDLRGTVWVTDFGLAKATDADDLTHAGDIVGTLRYMAPERFDGAGDARADVDALGLTLYELLTLQPAFVADNRAKLVEQVTAASPPKPRSVNPAIPKDLETVVLKAIARDPAMRYQSAEERAEDLRRYLEDRPIRARRASSADQAFRWCRRNPTVASLLAAVLLVFAVGAGVSAYFALQADHERTRAERKEKDAREEARRADDERNRASAKTDEVEAEKTKLRREQDRTSRLLDASQMNQAQRALDENRFPDFERHMDEMTPTVGEPDLRGWEWHDLDRLTRADRAVRLSDGDLPSFEGFRDHRAAVRVAGGFAFPTSFLGDFYTKPSSNFRWFGYPRQAPDGVIYEVWHTLTGKRVARFPLRGLDFTTTDWDSRLTDDGRHLVYWNRVIPEPGQGTTPTAERPPGRGVGVSAGRFRVWKVATGEEITGLEEPLERIASQGLAQITSPYRVHFEVGPDSNWIAWIECPDARPQPFLDGLVEIRAVPWDRISGRTTSVSLTVGKGRGRVRLSRDGKSVFWQTGQTGPGGPGGGPRGVFERWDLAGEKPRLRFQIPVETGNVSINGRETMVAITTETEVIVHQLSDGAEQWRVPLPKAISAGGDPRSRIRWTTVSDDGTRLVLTTANGMFALEKGPANGAAPGTTRRWRHVEGDSISPDPSHGLHLLEDDKPWRS